MIILLNDLVDKRINELISLQYLNTSHIFFIKEILKEVKLYKVKNMIIVENYLTITKKDSQFIFSYNSRQNETIVYHIQRNFEEIINLIYESNIFRYGMSLNEIKEERVYVRKIYIGDSIFNSDKYIVFNSKEDLVNFNDGYKKLLNVLEPILYDCLIEFIEENFKVKDINNNI